MIIFFQSSVASDCAAPAPEVDTSSCSMDVKLEELEQARSRAQQQSEINSVIHSLQTNLILCITFVFIFIFVPLVNPTVKIVLLALLKSLIPVLTTVANFGKIQELILFYLVH